ncbi:hypothetical protein Pden_5124 (plasmid) [Paracoccus denitrificans PD1222]|uniref:Uncharacterized protein n=1 Tax=Paracoccus denitrificans (strain Pd 1222) TaxID=318586 RepID=A1BCE0_PARDP|nr:hypothetical protein Pden_5124 [Paracoccus denitrificans PD1222]
MRCGHSCDPRVSHAKIQCDASRPTRKASRLMRPVQGVPKSRAHGSAGEGPAPTAMTGFPASSSPRMEMNDERLPPEGESLEWPGPDVWGILDDKIDRHWERAMTLRIADLRQQVEIPGRRSIGWSMSPVRDGPSAGPAPLTG